VSAGVPLTSDVSRFLCGPGRAALGLPLAEGNDLMEAAPVIMATTLEDNLPDSVGRPLHGVEISLRSATVVSSFAGA